MFNKLVNSAFEYETQKMVQIQSKLIGSIYRLIQLVIILYIVIWVMIRGRGYQSHDTAVSGVTAKLKGISYIDLDNYNVSHFINHHKQKLWDAADYVIPPQQNSAFFITTNLIMTAHQTQGICDEAVDVYGTKCSSDSDCRRDSTPMLGNGRQTGRCVNSTQKMGVKTCQIFGWCPTEYDEHPLDNVPLIGAAPNFTVLFKNSIEFPRFKVKRRNVLPWMTKKFLYTCNYHPNHPTKRYCPIFRIGDIARFANADTPSLWFKGGMISINIKWECDLDFSVKYCLPEYSFRRLDDPVSPIAKGWNFRYSYKYYHQQVQHRTLVKAYGIQFFITVYGKAYKFDWYTLSMNIGSGIGLLGLATVICDMVVLNLLRNREAYQKAKVDLVTRDESPAKSDTKPENYEISETAELEFANNNNNNSHKNRILQSTTMTTFIDESCNDDKIPYIDHHE